MSVRLSPAARTARAVQTRRIMLSGVRTLTGEPRSARHGPQARLEAGQSNKILSDAEIMTDAVLYDVTDGVATITLNRPDRLNAMNDAMFEGLMAAFDRSDGDDEVRAVS